MNIEEFYRNTNRGRLGTEITQFKIFSDCSYDRVQQAINEWFAECGNTVAFRDLTFSVTPQNDSSGSGNVVYTLCIRYSVLASDIVAQFSREEKEQFYNLRA